MPTPSSLRALIIPHRPTVWAAESDYTQQGPRTGAPDPAAPSAMALVGSGTQDSGSDLDLLITRPGFPLRGEAGLVWRRSDDTLYYGADVPSVIVDFTTPEPDAPSTDAEHPHLLSIPGGPCLMAYQYESAVSTILAVRRYSAGAWGSRITVATKPSTSQDLRPCLLLLPDGRVLALSWHSDGTDLTIRVHASADNGATWALYQSYALAVPLDATTITGRRIRAAYAGGQICVVAELSVTAATYIQQWASDDLCATLYAVGRVDGSTTGYAAKPEIWAWQGAFYLAYLSDLFGAQGALLRGGSAWESLSLYAAQALFAGAEALVIWTTAAAYDGELTIAQTDDGTLWGYGLHPGLDHVGVVYRSRDGGATWESVGESSTSASDPSTMWWNSTTADTAYPRDPAAAWHRGQVLIATEHTGSVRPDAIDVLHMGGASTVTLPPISLAQRDTRQVAWEGTWIPWDDPANLGYTAAGTGTSTITGDVLVITTTVGNLRSYTSTPGGATGDATQGVIVLADVEVTSGGSVSVLNVGMRIRTADGSAGYEVEIRLSTTQLRLYDAIAASTLATATLDGTTYPAMSAGIRILCALADGAVALWVCAQRTDERAWTLVHQGAVTDDSAAGGTANTIVWGHPTLAVSGHTSEWRQVHTTHEEFTGTQLAAGQSNPNELFPLALTSRPIYVADGALVRGVGGPAARADAWTLTADAEHSLSGADLVTEPSVRRVWRSIDDSTDQIIAWQLDAVAESYADATEALWLAGCNWRTATLDYHDGSTWQTLTSLDLAEGLTALPYLRQGSTITVDTASTPPGSEWLDRAELVGATVDLGSGKLRRVLAQTDGTWSDSGRLPVLTLADCDGTEPASGTCTIWQTTALLLIHHDDTTRLRQGYRLTIDAQTTVDGDLRAKYLLGVAVPFAVNPDEASDREISAPVEEIEETDGTVYRRALGPARRRVTWTWSDGDLEHWIGGDTPDPPTWTLTTTTGAPVAAAHGTTARHLQALVTELDALARPVIVALYVPSGPPDAILLTRRRLFLPAMIEGPISIEETQGVRPGADSEYEGRLVRVGTVALRELV